MSRVSRAAQGLPITRRKTPGAARISQAPADATRICRAVRRPQAACQAALAALTVADVAPPAAPLLIDRIAPAA